MERDSENQLQHSDQNKSKPETRTISLLAARRRNYDYFKPPKDPAYPLNSR